MKCHRNGFADCLKGECALWLVYNAACGDRVIAQLAQEELADRFDAEQRKRMSLKIECPDIHHVGVS